jgi:predicted phage terminase large subunit-like protein
VSDHEVADQDPLEEERPESEVDDSERADEEAAALLKRAQKAYKKLSYEDKVAYEWRLRWLSEAHQYQLIPEGDWDVWLLLAGRGAGKSRTGAETIGHWAWRQPKTRWLVVAPTSGDLRDVCFPAGTLITMGDGRHQSIESVRPGATVMTRRGPRRVLKSGCTGIRDIYRVRHQRGCLIATSNHPVWVNERQTFVFLCSLLEGDTILTWAGSERLPQRSRNSTASPSGAIPSPVTSTFSATSMGTGAAWIFPCIAPNGLQSTGPSLSACMSITWIMTGATMLWRTLGSVRPGIISMSMRLWNGFVSALSVARNLWPDTRPSSARIAAAFTTPMPIGIPANAKNPTSSLFAPAAEQHFLEKPVLEQNVTVQPSAITAPCQLASVNVPVYNLEVEDEHEYFADDVLVHNCFEGPSGLVNVIPRELWLEYNRSLHELTLRNGSLIKGISASEPNRFRGPQFHGAWCDELAAWDYLDDSWSTMRLGIRLGQKTRTVATTTPKPKDLLKRLLREEATGKTVVSRASTYENLDNLAPSFREEILQHEGTRYGRQEIHAEMIDPEETGIVKRSWFKLWPSGKKVPELLYLIQSYDTATSEKTINDPTACTTWGVFKPSEDIPWSIMLMDAWSEYMQYPELKEKVIAESKAIYESGEGKKSVDLILVEEKSSGIALVQDLQRAGLWIRPYNPGKADKIQRLNVVAPMIQQGRVYVPESIRTPGQPRNWADPFISEICSVPDSTHDDYTDSCTQALRMIRDLNLVEIHIPRLAEDSGYAEDSLVQKQNPYAA